ncbi:MAG: cytochrome c biogenesis protein CcsA [Thermoplasmatota archaeon]
MQHANAGRAAGWTAGAALVALLALAWATWLPTPFGPAPDWTCPSAAATCANDVAAPLTRKLLLWHPALAWATFAAYLVTFAMSIAYLNERQPRHDATARSAAEVGFLLNTLALVTGTLWGMQEWSRSGQSALATVYTEPKVLVVVVMWLAFAAYLLLRRLVDDADRRARLAAAFGILGFLGVPASFLVSRVLAKSLHPDVVGPAANPDAALSSYQGWLLGWSFVAMTLLFVALFLARLRLARAEERLAALETA